MRCPVVITPPTESRDPAVSSPRSAALSGPRIPPTQPAMRSASVRRMAMGVLVLIVTMGPGSLVSACQRTSDQAVPTRWRVPLHRVDLTLSLEVRPEDDPATVGDPIDYR